MFTFSVCNLFPTFYILLTNDEVVEGEARDEGGGKCLTPRTGNFAKTFRLIFAVVMTLTDTISRCEGTPPYFRLPPPPQAPQTLVSHPVIFFQVRSFFSS